MYPNVISPSSTSTSSISSTDYDILEKAFKSRQPQIFQHRNGRKSTLLFVPVCSTPSSFKSKGRGKDIIRNMVESMSDDVTAQSYQNECFAARHIIDYLSKAYPASFESVSNQFSGKELRLDPHETTALIEYCDITRDTAYNKLNKFFLSRRGANILCPKRSLKTLSNGAPRKEVSTTTLDCDTKKEKKTQIAESVITTMHENIFNRMERYLTESDKIFNVSTPTDMNRPMFGYNNPDDPDCKSVLGVIGTDHGQKHSQFQLALHLLPSSARRAVKDKGHGILTIPFSTIKCDKENSNVLKLTSASVNRSIDLLEKNKLMCVKHEKNVHCFWMNKSATNIRVQIDAPLRRRICYTVEGSTFSQCLPDWCQLENITLSLFTVLSPIHFLVVSDINAMFLLQGRDGSSPNKCLKCDLSVFEWKRDKTKIGNDLTADMLVNMLRHKTVKAINKAGMTNEPLFNLPPSRYLCPLLHLLLGLINDILAKAIIPFALCMDGCTEEELEIRHELESNEPMRPKKRISLKAKLKRLVKQRTSKCFGTDTAIRNALTESGLYFENYHGGSMNGNNCQKLCSRARELTDVCMNICLEKLRQHETEGNIPSYSPTISDCEQKFESIAQVLEIADVVFAQCNILAPTENEIADLEDSIAILEEKWHSACLPVTPKAHLTFRHLIIDVRRFNGLGDKQEQELERRHQIQKKWCNRLRNIRMKTTALSLQFSYEWSNTHPRVEHILSQVSRPTRKRKGQVLTLQEENEQKRGEIKQRKRDEVVCRLVMDVEESSDGEDN